MSERAMIYPLQGHQRSTINSISSILDPLDASVSSSNITLLDATPLDTKETMPTPALESYTLPNMSELEEAAKACRLYPKKMTDLERSIFPRFSKLPNRRAYLEIRNVVLYLWLKKPARFLKLSQVLEFMAKSMHRGTDPDMVAIANNTYNFLHRYRYINYGVLTLPNIKSPDSPATAPSARRPIIVIIGAGMAGLTAAREISNIFSVFPPEMRPILTILEARQRLGGRIFSYPLHLQPQGVSEPARVDLGANVLHGLQGGNPLSVMLQHQLKADLVHLSHADDCSLYDHNGKRILVSFDDECDELFEECLEKASRTVFNKQGCPVLLKQGVKDVKEDTDQTLLDDEQPPEKHFDMSSYPSLGQVLEYYFTSSLTQQSKTQREKYARILNWHVANLESTHAACLDDLSLHHYDQYDDFVFEGPACQLNGGLSKLIEGTFIGRPSQDALNIQFNSIVTDIRIQRPGEDGSVSHPNDGLIHITCENGQSFMCDAAIVTLPLGVLKENKLGFHPPLPTWKKETIDRLGFGVYNKVVLVFPHCFWKADMELIGLVNEKDGHSKEKNRPYHSSRGRYFSFWNLLPTTGLPVLVAYVSGQAALDMEDASDDEVVIQAMQVLAKVYDRKKPLPWPVETIVTRWGRDPFARGAYSHVPTGATGDDYDTMAKPIWNKVFWAGEATCREYPATVHGAIVSGMRAASSLADGLLGIVDDTTVNPTANDIITSTSNGCMRRNCQETIPNHLSLLDHVVRHHGASEMRDLMMDGDHQEPFSREIDERGFQNFREEWRRELATELNATSGTLKSLDRHLTKTWESLSLAQKKASLFWRIKC